MTDPRIATLSGLWTAILTPFDVEGRLRLDWYPALIEFQRQAGIDGLVVCGTNGEGTSLSVEERKRTLEAVMGHRGDLTVVAGTGAASVTDAVDLTRHAAAVGADAALVLPPFFMKNPAPQGLIDYFRRVLDCVDLPILLYSIPQMTAVPITDEVLDALLDHPNLAGVKDSAGDWERTLAIIRRYPQLRIFPGSDYLAARGWLNGAAGCISGGANAFPDVVAEVRNAAQQGADAQGAQERLDGLADITRRYTFIAVSKAILARRGLPNMGVRPPLVPLTADTATALFAELEEAGFLPARHVV